MLLHDVMWYYNRYERAIKKFSQRLFPNLPTKKQIGKFRRPMCSLYSADFKPLSLSGRYMSSPDAATNFFLSAPNPI